MNFVNSSTEDKTDWNQPLSGPKVSSSYKERRSATPSKSTQFSLVNMATMRSQSESPPHYQPLPLDEYIRPTSRQGPSIMTGSIHRPNTPLRSGSRGPPDVPLVEALITLQRPGSFADFVRRGESICLSKYRISTHSINAVMVETATLICRNTGRNLIKILDNL